jgi:hypothetical protein
VTYWTRPGKDPQDGWSATTGFTRGLHVWSDNAAPFEPNRSHSKFHAYALLNHAGSHTDAAAALAAKGYGKPSSNGRPQDDEAPKPWENDPDGGIPAGQTDLDNGGKRVEVEITTDRHIVRDNTVAALARDQHVFARGDTLVMVVRPTETTRKLSGNLQLRKANNPRIAVIDDANLGCLLTQNAEFYKWYATKAGEPVSRSVQPPDWLIKAVASKKFWPDVQPDGRIIKTEGYDESTGTLLIPAFPLEEMPKHPSKADALAAYARLKRLTKDFPFENDDSFHVWLADLLTSIERPVISGNVPGFAYNGNKAGCGKGLLVDCIGHLVWGGDIPAMDYPDDPKEASKVVLAIALDGIQAVHFDNLTDGSSYGGSALDSALTKSVAEGRILGVSRMAKGVPLRPCWKLSGNNITPEKDAYRRWLPCNLKTQLESPHERDDCEIKDLKTYLANNRGSIVRDALLIMKAYAVAGRPPTGRPPLGSFETWDEIVRRPIEWITGTDLLTTQRSTASESPERRKRLALLEAWKSLPYGDTEGYTAAEALALATPPRPSHDNPDPKPLSERLRAALLEFGRRGDLPSPAGLGYVLRGMRHQNYQGYCFDEGTMRHNTVVWIIRKV